MGPSSAARNVSGVNRERILAGLSVGAVLLATEIAYVEHDAAATDLSRIVQAIERAGYASGPPNC